MLNVIGIEGVDSQDIYLINMKISNQPSRQFLNSACFYVRQALGEQCSHI